MPGSTCTAKQARKGWCPSGRGAPKAVGISRAGGPRRGMRMGVVAAVRTGIEPRRLLPRAVEPGPRSERLLVGSPGHETTDDPTDPILPGIDAEATGRRATLLQGDARRVRRRMNATVTCSKEGHRSRQGASENSAHRPESTALPPSPRLWRPGRVPSLRGMQVFRGALKTEYRYLCRPFCRPHDVAAGRPRSRPRIPSTPTFRFGAARSDRRCGG